ncbi:MAG: isochorismate synthase [Acidimicrobiales bacterium]
MMIEAGGSDAAGAAGAAALRSGSVEVTTEEFGRLRALAFATGRVIERDGLSVLGFGEAATIELPAGLTDPSALRNVTRALASLAHSGTGEAGRPLVAMGAFGFLPEAPAVLVVPSLLVLARAGAPAVAVAVGAAPRTAVTEMLSRNVPAKAAPPDSFRLESCRSHDDFLARVSAAVTEIRAGRLAKVVLAREVRVEANRPMRQEDLLERLRALHPSCLSFALEGFVGATPELLIRRQGLELESNPLAGTAARSGDPEADKQAETALLTSAKERAEHRAVVEAIAQGLAPAVAELRVPEDPSIVELRNVSHLGTHITGRLGPRGGGDPPSALELLALIHPTPAVSGTPRDIAIDYLAKAEDLDRDRYAGALGWIDASGDGEWHLGIRCAIVEDRAARLFAGVGIVADSDPAAELAETQLKLQAFLAAAVRP